MGSTSLRITSWTECCSIYAPVTVLVDERDDGVHLSYDGMASYLASYENAAALDLARNLDAKVESLLRRAAGRSYAVKAIAKPVSREVRSPGETHP